MTFTIKGSPRTKKNHGRVVRVRGRPFHIQSKAHERWLGPALLQLQGQMSRIRRTDPAAFPIGIPINCEAHFYRDANRGDAVGYYQALADCLQAAGIVEDDKLIVSWDRSRVHVNKIDPCIVLTLVPA